ncbi:MAG: hypothetical protein GEU83_02250 [Pseudonocardiaceae bacterium]|nr:hypothetical protein [Pseudonocardiaceae bacterium]
MTGHTAGERYRFAVHAQRTDPQTGARGGACTLLVIRLDDQVLLLHHGALSTGAALTPKQAAELADCMATAAGVDRSKPDRRHSTQ